MKNFGHKNKNWWRENFGLIALALILTSFSAAIIATRVKSSGYSLASGHSLLVFFVFLFITLIVVGILYKSKTKSWPIEKIFLICGLTLGVLYSVAVPVGGVPDEPAHFLRAYELSEGQLVGQIQIPDNLDTIAKTYFLGNGKYAEELNNLSIKASTEYVTSDGSADNYFVFNYIPQIFGILVGKILGLPLIPMMFISRIFNMAFCIFIIYLCIKHIPVMKKLVFLIALFPMSMQLFASVSADGSIICAGMAMISFVLYTRKVMRRTLGWKDYLLILILCLVLVTTKPVYAFLCPILFWIPKNRFKSKKHKLGVIILVGIITVLFVLARMKLEGESRFGDSQTQINFIVSNPVLFLGLIFKNFFLAPEPFINSLIGKNLEWFSVELFAPYIITLFVLFVLLCAEHEINISRSLRAFAFFAFSAILVSTFTTMFIQWSMPGSSIIEGVQGRYFIPVLLLIPILCFPSSSAKTKRTDIVKTEYLCPIAVLINVYAIAIIFCTHIFG